MTSLGDESSKEIEIDRNQIYHFIGRQRGEPGQILQYWIGIQGVCMNSWFSVDTDIERNEEVSVCVHLSVSVAPKTEVI